MRRAEWWSQPFPADGTMASEGLRKQLGTPRLEPLVVLLRESSQNCWDARTSDGGPVHIEYAFETLDETRSIALRNHLQPAPEGAALSSDTLAAGRVLLRVSDRGTSGLGGPLRSDEPIDGRSADFVNLLRNVGEPRDRQYGGGTYGFGKGILFSLSTVSTILVDSTCIENGQLQRRLMGAALGHSFVRNDRRYTGRHWLGAPTDGIVDPLLDTDAATFANEIGLRGFASGETGTDIYILAPNLGSGADGEPRTPEEAARVVASAAAWYLWPKLISRRSQPPQITLSVTCNGKAVPVPDPKKSRRLRPFVHALERLDLGSGAPLERKSAPRVIGHFAFFSEACIDDHDPVLAAAQPFEGAAHHCARMRHVELVVDYLAGPDPSLPDSHYGAVFRGSTEADEYLAQAEPPTHDSWVSEHLSGTAKGVVTRARKFVLDELSANARPAEVELVAAEVPLGRLSSDLARAIPGVRGDGGNTGAGASNGGGGGGGGGGSQRVVAVGQPHLELMDRTLVVVQEVRFEMSTDMIRASATASVAVDGGRERTAPAGAEMPTIIGWLSDTGKLVDGDQLAVNATEPRKWKLIVHPARDTATMVSVKEQR